MTTLADCADPVYGDGVLAIFPVIGGTPRGACDAALRAVSAAMADALLVTLLVCGVPADDPAVQKAVRFVRVASVNADKTYELALSILFLDKLIEMQKDNSGQAKKIKGWDRDRIEIMAAQTRAWTERAGTFDVIGRYELPSRCAAVLLSPVHGVLEPRLLSQWMLEDDLPVRLQLQLHKFIWPADTRGV